MQLTKFPSVDPWTSSKPQLELRIDQARSRSSQLENKQYDLLTCYFAFVETVTRSRVNAAISPYSSPRPRNLQSRYERYAGPAVVHKLCKRKKLKMPTGWNDTSATASAGICMCMCVYASVDLLGFQDQLQNASCVEF